MKKFIGYFTASEIIQQIYIGVSIGLNNGYPILVNNLPPNNTPVIVKLWSILGYPLISIDI